jgi:hypothetical protein
LRELGPDAEWDADPVDKTQLAKHLEPSLDGSEEGIQSL